MKSYPTIINILQHRSLSQPAKIAYTFLGEGKTSDPSLTYQELDLKARAIAGYLQSFINPGERSLLIYSNSYQFLCVFLSCLYIRAIAVPCPPLEGIGVKRTLSRIKSIAEDSGASSILTTSELLPWFEAKEKDLGSFRKIKKFITNKIPEQTAKKFQHIDLDRNSLAYLQYTSGSTSTPKGVSISHDNLMQNLADINREFDYTPDSIAATWVPYSHDLGLVKGLLQPLYSGIPCYVMSSWSFMKRPFHWLKTISDYRVTHSDAPNFAYDYCVSQINPEQCKELNLSNWRQAGIGAEPISRDTVERFSDTFRVCGFNKISFYFTYGLAEATLCCSVTRKKTSPNFCTVESSALAKHRIVETSLTEGNILAKCGYPIGDTRAIVVNPESLTRCSGDRVGEIWISGGSVAQGYWNRPNETKLTFQAYLADTGEGAFLRTGDLGFIKDGELVITGRLKDLIIIRGQNYYPQDIESIVESSHGKLRANHSAVFSVDLDELEHLVVTAEVDASSNQNFDTEEILAAIRNAIAQQYDLPIYAIVLLKRGSIPKTSSGKIQRHACKSGFLSESLSVVDVNIQHQNTHHQIKKIEEILTQHPNVDRSVIITEKDDNQNNIFIAYIIPTQERVPTIDNLRNFLKQKLPDRIIYITFVPLQEFPLTPNGDLDRIALSALHGMRENSERDYVNPRNSVEQKLASIWAEVLWLEEDVSINDNFFVMGGNSLLAASLVGKIEEEFNIRLSPEDFSQLSTIANLAPSIEQKIESNTRSTTKQFLTTETNSQLDPEIYHQLLTYTAGWQGKRAKPNSLIVGVNTKGTKQALFWCFNSFAGCSQLAKYLGVDQPIYGMRSYSGILEPIEYNKDNIKALAAHYVSEILTVQSEGSYLLGGNCQGAWIMFEIAQQLANLGKKVTLLSLIQQYILQPYSGKIAFFFQRESDFNFNPYKLFDSPKLGWRKFYSGGFSVDIIPGSHGDKDIFKEPNIQIISGKIRDRIEEAQSVTPQLDREKYQLLPPEAYRAEITTKQSLIVSCDDTVVISVVVKNISPITWQSTAYSAIKLGNHWLNEGKEVIQWIDSTADLTRDLESGEEIEIALSVNVPSKVGRYFLELDLVEEGVTWFKEKGSKTTLVAIEVIASKSTLDVRDGDFYYQKGDRYFEKGNAELAIINYRKAIDSGFETSVKLYQNLGDCFSQLQQWDEAIVVYNQAIELQPDNSYLYFRLGKAQAKQGKIDESIASLQKSLNLESNNSTLLQNIGDICYKLKKLKPAKKAYQKVLQSREDGEFISDLYGKLGMIELWQANTEGAIYYLEKSLEISFDSKKNVKGYLLLGKLQSRVGNFAAAAIAYVRVIKLKPKHPDVYVALADVRVKLGDMENAISCYQKAIELNAQQSFRVYQKLGDAFSETGKLEQAITAYQQAIKLNPNHLNINQKLFETEQQMRVKN